MNTNELREWEKNFRHKWEGANTGTPLSSLVIMDMIYDFKEILSLALAKRDEENMKKVEDGLENYFLSQYPIPDAKVIGGYLRESLLNNKEI
jgi:hypothetical protein